MWVKIENGVIVQWGLPETGFLKDGSGVSGYNQLDEEILRDEGWLPLVDNIPEYDNTKEYPELIERIIGDTEVTAVYVIKQISPPPLDEIAYLRARLEAAEERAIIDNQNLMEFMDFYFANNPEL